MKLVSCALLLAALAVMALESDETVMRHQFSEFASKYRRQYASVQETFERYNLFKKSLQRIQAHKGSYSVGLNELADRSPEELRLMSSGFHAGSQTARTLTLQELKLRVGDLPPSVDWRKEGAVTPVWNQGQCGSSPHWATSTAAEGYNKIHGGKLVELSTQQLMDCALVGGLNQGCNGAFFEPLMNWIVANGSCTEKDYPYKADDAPCISGCKPAFAGFRGYGYVNVSEEMLQYAVALGPVATAMAVGNGFEYYSGGVYDGSDCPDQPSHGIAIVGYGDDNGNPYWILKNSWGPSWGEQGYARLARGKNACAIKDYSISPI